MSVRLSDYFEALGSLWFEYLYVLPVGVFGLIFGAMTLDLGLNDPAVWIFDGVWALLVLVGIVLPWWESA